MNGHYAATFRRRFIADMIDALVWLGIAALLTLVPQIAPSPLPDTSTGLIDDLTAFAHTELRTTYVWLLTSLVLGTAYSVVARTLLKATLGEYLLGVRLITSGGQPIHVYHSVVHSLVMVLGLCLCGLGYLWALSDTHRQTWANYLSSTRLIRPI